MHLITHHHFYLSEAGQVAEFNVKLITVEVGSRGLIDTTQFSELGTVLGIYHKRISQLFTDIIRRTVLESYKIWCCRNIHTYLLCPMPAVFFFLAISLLSVCISFVTHFCYGTACHVY